MKHAFFDPRLLTDRINAPTDRTLPIGFDRFSDGHPLSAAWERLEEHAPLPTQSHGFVAALADSMLTDARIDVFIARDRGRVAGLLPLCRDAGYFARLRQPGAREVFEPADALYTDEDAAHLLAAQIARQQRPVTLDRVPATSALVPALQAAMKGRGLVSVRPAVGCPTLALDATWHEPENRFNSGRRSDFRRAARRAAQHGNLFYEIIAPDPAEFDALFDEAIAVEIASWKREAGTAIASDPAKEAFFRAFFLRAAARGSLRIAFLRIDRRAIAMQLAIESGGRYWLFKIGYDEAFGKCSPGTLLMLHTVGHAARQGLTAYEMLGDVEPWIAELWTQDEHKTVKLRTYPFNPRGAVALAQDGGLWMRERLRAQRARP